MVYQELMKSPSHITSLASFMYQLQQQGYLCDCIIQTCQANLNVHQVVLLASGSPYFRKNLYRVANTGQVKSSFVLLKDQDLCVVQAVVQFVYTGEMYITSCNVDKIFNVCSLLGLEEAVKLCQMFRHTLKCSTNGETVNNTAGLGLKSNELKEQNSSEAYKHCRSENIALKRNFLSNAAENDVISEDILPPNIPSSTLSMDGADKEEIDTSFKDARFDENNKDNSVIKTKEFSEDQSDRHEVEYSVPLLRSTVARAKKPDFKSQHSSIDSRSRKAKFSLTKSGDVKTTCKMLRSGGDSNDNEDQSKEKQFSKKRKTTCMEGNISDNLKNRKQRKNLRLTTETNIAEINNVEDSDRSSSVKCNLTKMDETFNPTTSDASEKRRERSLVSNFCRLCGIRFTDKEKFQEHKKKFHLFTCEVCGWSSNRGINLASHMYNQHGIHHEPKKYPLQRCDETGCDFKSILKHNVTIHKKIHSAVRQFKCDLCEASFKHKSQFNCHRKTHNPDALTFKCDVCEKAFPRNSLLNAHTKNVHQQDELCHLCPWKSSSRRELHIHLFRIHDMPLPKNFKIFQCSICDYYTFTSIGYRSHMDRHSGKKYKCKDCGKFLDTEMRLYVHERKHKTDVKFKYCSYPDCSYKNKSKASLKIHHDAKHSDYKPFLCHICDFRCKVKGNLDKHLYGRHNVKVMTINKLWDKVMTTGQGYRSIVHRLKSFRSKGAIGMANECDAETEMDQNFTNRKESKMDSAQEGSDGHTGLVAQEGTYTQAEALGDGGSYTQVKGCLDKEDYTGIYVPIGERGSTQMVRAVGEGGNKLQNMQQTENNDILYSNIGISLSANASHHFALGFNQNI